MVSWQAVRGRRAQGRDGTQGHAGFRHVLRTSGLWGELTGAHRAVYKVTRTMKQVVHGPGMRPPCLRAGHTQGDLTPREDRRVHVLHVRGPGLAPSYRNPATPAPGAICSGVSCHQRLRPAKPEAFTLQLFGNKVCPPVSVPKGATGR